MKNENIVEYFISVFCFLLILFHIPNIALLLEKKVRYMAYIHNEEKFYKMHFPYFALNWHKFEYENISKYKYVIDKIHKIARLYMEKI